MFNSVQLIGNLGADPEVRFFESGAAKGTFLLYLNEKYTDKQGQRQERVHRVFIECWGRTAEFAGDYLRKGSKVAISGALNENCWDDKEGDKHSRLIVRAIRIENLTPRSQSEQSHATDDFEDDF